MASRKKQRGVVVHEDAASIPAADHLPGCFAPPKLGRTSEGGMAGGIAVKVGPVGKPNMNPVNRSLDSLPSDGLSPDSVCKGIKVTLDNNSMWNEFYKCRTEMILTKQGCRMFPYCRFRISGLQPSKKYLLVMDIQPFDNNRYSWNGSSWQVAGEAESRVKSAPFCHPESPSTGQHWMQNPVSFYKLKLTNNMADQEGNAILYPMHRYLPRLHVVQTDKMSKVLKLNGPAVLTFTFPQTEFMAVTGYQNSRFAQLKVFYNPFAKGLKEDGTGPKSLNLKLDSTKDLKDEEKIASELHPVKKSLKSLLASHKPRNSKVPDPKPSVSHDLQNCTINRDQSAAKSTGESSRSPPAQKLFSELIREAHVSLQRCNLQQLSINNNNNIHHKMEKPNTKTTTGTLNGPVDSKSTKTLPGQTDGGPVIKRKGRQDLLNSQECRVNNSSDSSTMKPSTSSSVDSPKQQLSEVPPDEKAKQHKRPVPLPLPALALFLKQHSTKSKKSKSRQDTSPQAPLLESLPKPPSSLEKVSPHPVRDETGESKDLTERMTESKKQINAPPSPKEKDCSVYDEAVKTNAQSSSPLDQNTSATSDPNEHRTPDLSCSDPEGRASELTDGSPVLSNSDQPLSSIISSSHTTSSSTLPTSCLPVLPVQESLLSDPLCMKSDSLLPDPECSSFVFESMSPASSPEPLPSLPVSFTLGLDSEPTDEHTPVHPEEFMQQNPSSASVFKWHTVLPPPEHYNNSSFSTFQAASNSLPLDSVTSPVLPSENPSLPEPKSLDPSTPPPEAAPSFEENEQVLPFPAELSPLALQLPLSPTFSLDGEGLSPTPSLTDLVQLFSIDVDLGMGVEFSNSELGAASCLPQSTGEADAQELPQPTQVSTPRKPGRPKKKCRRQKVTKTNVETVTSTANSTLNSTANSINSTINTSVDFTYVQMQPNLEEVEEQLFVSFTSKEALKLHVVDSLRTVCQPQTTPEVHLQSPADSPKQVGTTDSLEDKVASLQMILLKDLKLMRHRQVIHPVLQEVGLKMNLLDPAQAIDLQYLGVRLPIPPPGVFVEPVCSELAQSKDVSGAFMSRTGKTTDVTQIKGWREKFNSPEAPTPLAVPEGAPITAVPGSDPPKKNLSAFCSDMLDEYLENEGKLIDQRADSFSQPQINPPVYQLPTTSTSYVRTLDSILKKQPAGSPTSDLISAFVPPSKRPKQSASEFKAPRIAKRRGPKPLKPRQEPDPARASLPESNLVTKQPAVPTLSETNQISEPLPPSEPSPPIVKAKRRKHHPKFQSDIPQSPELKKRRRLKNKTMSQAFDPSSYTDSPLAVSEDLAPLESDSELGDENHNGLVMTRALLRQKDLEDGGVWEGQPRARITEDRAAIALTSLFTLKGFVTENPTKPVQMVRRRAPSCLNEFCRLGCVCSSLSYTSRISHCGRPACMFGCSCLKQKVVLLKNLDTDSSPSGQENKKRRKRRMKMAYVLKEADSVSQPAERVQTLWKKDSKEPDPDPIQAPKRTRLPSLHVKTKESSCARVRVYHMKKRDPHQKEMLNDKKLKDRQKKPKKPKDPQSSNPPTANGPDQLVPSSLTHSMPSEDEPIPKPSKRLIILAEGKWGSAADRSHVLKQLCERMARDQLDQPFWVWGYRIAPIGQTVEGSGPDRCIQYRVHISRPEPGPEKQAEQVKPGSQETSSGTQPQQNHLKQVSLEAEIDREGPPEDWQREVEEDEEEEPFEDWQHEVEEEDKSEEEAESTRHQVHFGHIKGTEGKMLSLGLPWLTGVSPAGFLSTNRKQPGGTDYLVQVNGKLYPLAKIQLGQMGALHPANRLAAYLTGRVGVTKKQPDSSKPIQKQNPGPAPHTATSSSSAVSAPPPKPQPSVPVLTIKTTPSEIHPPIIVQQSAEGGGQKVVKYKLYPCQTGGANQVRMVPEASAQPTPPTDNQLHTILGQNQAVRGVPLMVVPAQGPTGKIPAPGPAPLSTSQRMILKPVQTTSGAQYYRRPDGKLVQLFPISQLRPVNPSQIQTLSTQGDVPLASGQSPSLPVGGKAPPKTSLHPLSVTSLPTQRPPAHTIVTKKPTCNIRIFPPDPTKEPLVVTCVKVPPPPPVKVLTGPALLTNRTPTAAPKNFISLSPSTVGGTEFGVKTVTVAPITTHEKPQIETQISCQAPTRSEVTHLPPSEPAVERVRDRSPDLMDLDIMCEETEITATEKVDRAERASHTEAKSDKTKNSTDFDEETQSKAWKGKSSKDDGQMEASTKFVFREVSEGAVVEMGEAESSETETSTDTEVDKPEVRTKLFKTENSESETLTDEDRISMKRQRYLRSLEARQQRRELSQLFKKLERELELQNKPSRITILNKAEQLIQELRKTETNLINQKRQLIKENNCFFNSIIPTTESEHSNVMEVQLLDNLKKTCSEEEKIVTMTTNMVDNDTHSISADELNVDQGSHSSDTSCQDLKNSLSRERTHTAFKALRSVLNNTNSSKHHLLKQAYREIQSLQCEMKILKSLKSCLRKQRDAYLKKILQRSAGKGEQKTSEKQPSPKKTLTSNQLPDSEGSGVSSSADKDSLSSSSSEQQQASKAPSALTSPTTTPASVPVLLLAPPTSSHMVSVTRDRVRTVPNILSRSKKTVKGLPSLQKLIPTRVLSLVGAPFSGQPVLTMSPLMPNPIATPASADVASVTLNISGLPSQQIHLTPVLEPQTATNVNNLLQLVQQTGHPSTMIEQQQTHLPTTNEPTQQATTKQAQQQTTQQPTTQQQQQKETKDQLPQSSQSQSIAASGLWKDSSFRGDSDTVGVTERVTDSMDEPADSLVKAASSTHGLDDSFRGASGLTSLLHEIDFLNQQDATSGTAGLEAELQEECGSADRRASEQAEPWLLELDSDSEETTTMETKETETMRSQEQSGFLAPPPLLQMKVGKTKEADPAITELAAGDGGGVKGLSWKPMPRLVPLGLRGHAPS